MLLYAQLFLSVSASTAATAVVTAVTAASALEKKSDNYSPDNPFTTVISATIIKEHNNSPFKFYIFWSVGSLLPTLT